MDPASGPRTSAHRIDHGAQVWRQRRGRAVESMKSIDSSWEESGGEKWLSAPCS